MKAMLEEEAFHMLNSQLPEDQWPELEISNATISIPKSGREEAYVEDFRDLLQVNQCGPFRLEGRVTYIDERKPALKGMLKNRDVVNCRLIVPEVVTYSMERTYNREKDELESSLPIIWVLGNSAWYKITIPHQDYQSIHEESIKQAKLWLHTEDYYLDPDSVNKFAADLFKYYSEEDHDCHFQMEAETLFKKYRRFIMVRMVDDEEIKQQRQWSHTPLWAFYQENYPSELRQVQELLERRRIAVEKKAAKEAATKTPPKRQARATPKASTKRQRKSTTSTTASSTKSTRASTTKSRSRPSEVIDLTVDYILVQKDKEKEENESVDTPATKRSTRLRQASQTSTTPTSLPSTSLPALKQAPLSSKPVMTTATTTPKVNQTVSRLAPSISTTPAAGPSKLDLFLDFTQPKPPQQKSPPGEAAASPVMPAPPPSDAIRSRLSLLERWLGPHVSMTEPNPQEAADLVGPDAEEATLSESLRPNKRQVEEPFENPDKKHKAEHVDEEAQEPSFHTPPQSPLETPFETPSETPSSSKKKPVSGHTYPPYKPVASGFLIYEKTPNTCLFPSLDGTWCCEPCNYIIYDANCAEGKKLIAGHIKEHEEHHEEMRKVVEVVKVEAEAREFEAGIGNLMSMLESLTKTPARAPKPPKYPLGTITSQVAGKWNFVKK